MKRKCLILALVGFLTGQAWANVRAPLKVDGFFSGSLRSLPVSAAVKLVREDLRFVFPHLGPGLPDDGAFVGIMVHYEIFNTLAEEVEIPVRFLAVDIHDITASMDGRTLSVELTPDPNEKSECLWRLARHRTDFMGSFHKGFLGRMREAAGLKDVPDAGWLDALEGKDLAGIDPRKIYPVGRWRSEAADFRSAGMRLRFKPGINRLQIAYSQRMFIDERGYGYFSGWPKKGFSGVDYLLYPATSWPMDADFLLSVSIEIPEMSAKKFFGKKWLKPGFRSNLPFHEGKAERPHVRLQRAEFKGFPADILSILVWFDAKAPRYFSD